MAVHIMKIANADAVEINLNTKTMVNITMIIQGKHSIYRMLTLITQSNALLEFKVLTDMSVVTPPPPSALFRFTIL